MTNRYKAKLTHKVAGSSDCLVYEAYLQAESHDAACAQAREQFGRVVAALAKQAAVAIDKTKVEQNPDAH